MSLAARFRAWQEYILYNSIIFSFGAIPSLPEKPLFCIIYTHGTWCSGLLLGPVHWRPHQSGHQGKLLGHSSQQTELSQVPELEGGWGEGEHEILFGVGHADHRYPTFFSSVTTQHPSSILLNNRDLYSNLILVRKLIQIAYCFDVTIKRLTIISHNIYFRKYYFHCKGKDK